MPRPLGALLVVLLAVVAWSGSLLRGGFAFDDAELLASPVVTGALPAREAFAHDYWFHRGAVGLYRPVAALSLRVDRALFGARPLGYHATNVLLHALVVALAALLATRVRGASGATLLGVGLFAVHPALADAVAWIAGRTSLLSALGGLAGLACFDRLWPERADGSAARRALAAAGTGAAGLLFGLLAKEDALVFAPALLLLGASRGRRAALAALGAVGLALLAYAWLRVSALGPTVAPPAGAPLANVPLGERLVYAGRALGEALRLAVLPLGYPPTYRAAPGFARAAPPDALQLLAWLPWLALLGLGARALVRAARGRTPARAGFVGASALLAALALAPVLQLVPIGEVFAPRFLYLPLLLGAGASGAALARLPRALRGAALAACVVGAWSRAGVYGGRAAYAEATLAAVPDDSGAWNDLAVAQWDGGALEESRATLLHALALDPNDDRLWSNLGAHALAAGFLERAEEALRRGVALGPANPTVRANLGNLLLRTDRAGEALEAYRRATELAPGMMEAWRGLGNALLRLGRAAEARAALERARELAPRDPGVRRLLHQAGG